METDTSLLSYIFAAILAAAAAVSFTGCTGPMGMVLGGERVHELYNARFQQQYEDGFATDYHGSADKMALNAELDKRRRY